MTIQELNRIKSNLSTRLNMQIEFEKKRIAMLQSYLAQVTSAVDEEEIKDLFEAVITILGPDNSD